MPDRIKNIEAAEILDSRGNPTIEVSVMLSIGIGAKAAVPSGASTGIHEAHELRDGDAKRYDGLGVLGAVENVNTTINKSLKGFTVTDQKSIDEAMLELDGTDDKSKLGANAILGVSLACARVAALSQALPLYKYLRELTRVANKSFSLPIPLINVINGGKHASSNLDLQEFWIIPHKADNFKERLRQGSEIFHRLGKILKKDNYDIDVGNEGGYAPDFESHEKVFTYLLQAIEQSGFQAGDQIVLGLDAGASVFYDDATSTYHLPLEKSEFTGTEMIAYYKRLFQKYPIMAMEDGLGEEEWDSWVEMMKEIRSSSEGALIIGDDLFVTNAKRLQKGIDMKAANAILIKPNQVGTLTETLQCIALAQANGFKIAISHRSGETNDSFISDLSVAVNAEFIKAGAPSRGERTAKYNRLLTIENELYG